MAVFGVKAPKGGGSNSCVEKRPLFLASLVFVNVTSISICRNEIYHPRICFDGLVPPPNQALFKCGGS
jgi:hypothetical protein